MNNQKPNSRAMKSSVVGNYLIGPGDRVAVVIREREEAVFFVKRVNKEAKTIDGYWIWDHDRLGQAFMQFSNGDLVSFWSIIHNR